MVKRTILCCSTLVFLLGSYLLYARTVVPFVEAPPTKLEARMVPPGTSPNPADLQRALDRPGNSPEIELAREAFGPQSWEAQALFRMRWHDSGITIYFDEWEQTPEGEVIFKPLSMVFASPQQGHTTLQCQSARLQFARPVTITTFQDNEPIGGRLTDEVVVRNRRGTPDEADDFLAVTRDIEFSDQKGKLWSDAPVEFRDGQNQGRGVGLDLIGSDDLNSKAPSQSVGIADVRHVVLRRDVQMQLELDRDGGFLTGQRNAETPSGQGPRQAATVSVQSQGSLQFDLNTNTAVFRKAVHVERPTAPGESDTLDCDRLVIVFARKGPSDEKSADPESDAHPAGLAFQSLQATGEKVVLRSGEQDLEGYVTQLEYNAESKTTLLASNTEVVFMQKGNEIHCRQIVFMQSDAGNAIREMEALGPGWLNAKPDDGGGAVRVEWKDTMRSFPQGEFTVLAFVGNSRIEQVGQATLAADEIYVWIEPNQSLPDAERAAGDPATSQFQIDRMLAEGDVRMLSAQLNGELERLEVWFEDAPAVDAPPAVATSASGVSQPPTSPGSPQGASPRREQPTRLASDEPLHVRARLMQVKTIRTGDQIQISDLRAEGDVHAYRAPTAGDENSLKITGQKLWVTDAQGDAAQARIDGAPAHVESDALTLEGNNINLDYAKNHVWVNGVGMLAMPVAWDPAGGEPADKKPMEVRWQRRMFFNGEVAEFGGDVKIDADNRRVRCQSAQVTLAEPISFRDPPKQGSDRVNLKQVLCEERVVLDADVIEAGEIQGRDHAEVERFELHNGTGEMTADGPGIFVQTRRGMADPLAPGPPNPAAPNRRQGPSARAVSQRRSDTLDAPAEGRLTEAGEGDNAIRYTRIEFEDSMKGNTQDRRTRFFNRVEVTYGPVEDFDGVVDPNHLPDKALWMRSEELEVSQRPLQADGTRPVEMRASGKVRVEANAFFADADRLDYDEAKDMFVLEGSPRDPATLWRQQRLGAPVSSQRARKFIYWRQNGRIQVFDAQDGNFLDLPAPNRR